MSLDNRRQLFRRLPVRRGALPHVEGALGDASVCHCRMCQKAFGNFYAPLVTVRRAKA